MPLILSDVTAVGLRPAHDDEVPHFWCRNGGREGLGKLVIDRPETFMEEYELAAKVGCTFTQAQLIINLPTYGHLVADIDIKRKGPNDLDEHVAIPHALAIIKKLVGAETAYVMRRDAHDQGVGVHVSFERKGDVSERFKIADQLNDLFSTFKLDEYTLKADKVHSLWMPHVRHRKQGFHYRVIGFYRDQEWYPRSQMLKEPRLDRMLSATLVVDTRISRIITTACDEPEAKKRRPNGTQRPPWMSTRREDLCPVQESHSYNKQNGSHFFKVTHANTNKWCPACGTFHHSFYWLYFTEPVELAHLRCGKCGTIDTKYPS